MINNLSVGKKKQCVKKTLVHLFSDWETYVPLVSLRLPHLVLLYIYILTAHNCYWGKSKTVILFLYWKRKRASLGYKKEFRIHLATMETTYSVMELYIDFKEHHRALILLITKRESLPLLLVIDLMNFFKVINNNNNKH